MEPRNASPLSRVFFFFVTISLCGVSALSEDHHVKLQKGSVVEKDQRRTLLATEYGEITAIDIKEGPEKPPYHLQFFTLEPNSLFLPVLLHADMVFYVHTGSGKLTKANDGGTSSIPLREGDLCSLNEGSVFYIQSNLDAERRKLRIYAMFTNTEDNTFDPSIGAYSRISEMVKGFDKKIMQAALKVPDDVIEEIINKSNTPAIVHAVSEKRNVIRELEVSFLKNFLGVGSNSKKLKTYNIFKNNPDFKSHDGWSIAVTKKQLKSLKRTNIGFLMVHLSLGSILGPHWNPKATELSVVLEGEGMVRAVCGISNDETECQNMRFKVNEGDAFVVPRFHPMAQMSFNDGPFVFLGFSTSAKKNRPQFLAGKGSVLHVLDKQILATSFEPRESRGVEWEQEEARKQQEERERRREQEGDKKDQSHRISFEGRRVLKIRHV
uniref:Vicilin-like antimicrobial peptides 2-2 n=1 Tax=Cajanus cajan TaxID=3821 RepID=A0A151TI51_CAJCA|nr:Vicilin-like antimicrobial peptides 2-2 [Cajanus cajan]